MNAKEWYDDAISRRQHTAGFQIERVLLEIGEQLAHATEAQNLTQAELARRMGVSRSYVSRVLSGHPNLTIKSLVGIALALGLRVDIFLDPVHLTSFRSATRNLERSESPDSLVVTEYASALAA